MTDVTLEDLKTIQTGYQKLLHHHRDAHHPLQDQAPDADVRSGITQLWGAVYRAERDERQASCAQPPNVDSPMAAPADVLDSGPPVVRSGEQTGVSAAVPPLRQDHRDSEVTP